MDYSKLSDFEINKLVGIATKDATAVEPCFEVVIRNATGKEFNPCRNPADAWPIIVENKIAILQDRSTDEWLAFNDFTLYEGEWAFASDPERHVNDKNPLRAAMIVFLMMQ